MRGTRRPLDFLRLFVLAAATAGGLVLAGGAAAQPAADPMAGHSGHDALAPIGIEYVCGNLFMVTNSLKETVKVTYRVRGSGERGTLLLPAAPAEDPAKSETELQTHRSGAVAIFRDGHRVAVRANEGVSCGPSIAAAAAAPVGAAAPAQDGAWTTPFTWPNVAVHLHLLPNGQVLSFGQGGEPGPDGDPHVWNPATGGFTRRPSADNLFCAGHTFLADGRLFIAGGHISDDHGLPDINLYSTSGTWTSSPPMDRGRWYPTTTIMGNGQVVITAGRDEDGLNVGVPEVWSTTRAPPRRLTGASALFPYYPRAFLAPNGRLFYAGEQRMSRYLNISGAGSWTNVGNRRFGSRNYGSAVMYAPGKILYAGGAATTNTAEIIDLNVASPSWRFTAPMAFARRHHNLTVLPNGEVLATGGVAGTKHNDLTKPVRAAEIWNPTTGTWRTVASNAIVRGYHGTSILLPDGRVLNSGSGDAAGAPDQKNAEIYSPPYLFKGTRPTIGSAPTTIRYGRTFTVSTPNAGSIAKVSLIRLGSVTHAFDMNQRYQSLSFTSGGSGSLTVSLPSNPNITPPGHYMLFILNSAGVPSKAKIVKVQA